MERKIGEIFEYNGEWYQCLKGSSCRCDDCDFGELGKCYKIACTSGERSDNKEVYFKKLKKVGKPIIYMNRTFQRLKSLDDNICKYCYFSNKVCNPQLCGEVFFLVEIKKVAKDMEEENDIKPYDKYFSNGTVSNTDNLPKSNLKPFDLETAKAGKPVCTRDERKARIIAFDANGGRPIVALVTECDDEEEIPYKYHYDGSYNCQSIPSNNDLMMLPEKKEGWIVIHKEAIYDKETAEKIARETTANVIRIQKIEWEE